MSIWTRITDILSCATNVKCMASAMDAVVLAVRESFSPELRREVAFTMALVALTAKMAKADGVVSDREVEVVRKLFVVKPEEARNVSRLFNLAKEDVAGYESYAAKIRSLKDATPEMLEDVLDGLFMVAAADGVLHEREYDFLETVADIFGISQTVFQQIEARHLDHGQDDPFRILGLDRTVSPAAAKAHYRKLVVENHPDRLMARGLPEECIRIATTRLAAINAAYDKLQTQYALT